MELATRSTESHRIFDSLYQTFRESRGDEMIAANEACLRLMRIVLSGTMRELEDRGRGDEADLLQSQVISVLSQCGEDD